MYTLRDESRQIYKRLKIKIYFLKIFLLFLLKKKMNILIIIPFNSGKFVKGFLNIFKLETKLIPSSLKLYQQQPPTQHSTKIFWIWEQKYVPRMIRNQTFIPKFYVILTNDGKSVWCFKTRYLKRCYNVVASLCIQMCWCRWGTSLS